MFRLFRAPPRGLATLTLPPPVLIRRYLSATATSTGTPTAPAAPVRRVDRLPSTLDAYDPRRNYTAQPPPPRAPIVTSANRRAQRIARQQQRMVTRPGTAASAAAGAAQPANSNGPATGTAPASATAAGTSSVPVAAAPKKPAPSSSAKEVRLVHGRWSDSWVIIEKPAGLPVQAHPPLDSMEYRLRSLHGKRVIHFPHRLDKHTTGLLVVAFNPSVAATLTQSIHEWTKTYRVIAELPPCAVLPPTARTIAAIAAAPATPPPAAHATTTVVSPNIAGGLLNPDWTLASNGRLVSYLKRRPLNVSSIKSVASEVDHLMQVALPCGCIPPHLSLATPSPATAGGAPELTAVELAHRRSSLFHHPFIPQTMLHESANIQLASAAAQAAANSKGRRRPTTPEAAAKRSITDFSLVRVLPGRKEPAGGESLIGGNPLALYDVVLGSGRTHQIRIHFADAGCPVHADPYYNRPYIARWMKSVIKTDPHHPPSQTVLNTQATAFAGHQQKWAQSVGLNDSGEAEDADGGDDRRRRRNDTTAAPAGSASEKARFYTESGAATPTASPTEAPVAAVAASVGSDDIASRVVHSTKIQAYRLRMPNPTVPGAWVNAFLPLPSDWVALGFAAKETSVLPASGATKLFEPISAPSPRAAQSKPRVDRNGAKKSAPASRTWPQNWSEMSHAGSSAEAAPNAAGDGEREVTAKRLRSKTPSIQQL